MIRNCPALVGGCVAFLLTLLRLSGDPTPAGAPGHALPAGVSENDAREITEALQSLRMKMLRLDPAESPGSPASRTDLLADVALYEKCVTWALKYEPALDAPAIQMIRRSLRQGHLRADALLGGQTPWTTEKGRILRGFRSDLDGSTQPYGVVVPAGYDGTRPLRLDVVLHGSLSRWAGSAELRFETWFKPNEAGGVASDEDYIEIYPLGRVENGYRWAGETDIFEAIEAVSRNYRIDRDRIVLRGFSMGASGTWHVGLKHPDRFVALGPYSGYVDTRKFSAELADRGFAVGTLPSYQEKTLTLLDAVRYAANVGMVPAIAAHGGEDGSAMRNHLNMANTMAAEGQQMVNLVAQGAAHVINPVTKAKQLELIRFYADRGLDRAPRQLHFVTWSLRYNRCHWLELLRLDEHYARTEMHLTATATGSLKVTTAKNIAQFAIHPPMLQTAGATLEIDGHTISLPDTAGVANPSTWVFTRQNGLWTCSGRRDEWRATGKTPGLQGPIDDAFTSAFLCVRGTGQPWHPAVGAWADASLRRFAHEWERFMGGPLPVKDDTEVTADDLRTKNLVLFGDPASNSWIAQALPELPVKWSREEVRFGDKAYAAADHAAVLISPNPLPGATGRYLVINSGHTFHEAEFTSPNYLLFPRLGDWAVIKALPAAAAWRPAPPFPEATIEAGLFNEQWQVVPAALPAAQNP
ncbi:MAG TPA: prolyl oligopeptidase family serine peptidase [Lacunisphaera sp.]